MLYLFYLSIDLSTYLSIYFELSPRSHTPCKVYITKWDWQFFKALRPWSFLQRAMWVSQQKGKWGRCVLTLTLESALFPSGHETRWWKPQQPLSACNSASQRVSWWTGALRGVRSSSGSKAVPCTLHHLWGGEAGQGGLLPGEVRGAVLEEGA